MGFKGTKGEWVAKHRESAGFEVYNEDGNIICSMGWYQIPSEIMNIEIEKNNATLIASAPELLEALQDLLEVCPCQNNCAEDDMTCATNKAKKAINKALSNETNLNKE